MMINVFGERDMELATFSTSMRFRYLMRFARPSKLVQVGSTAARCPCRLVTRCVVTMLAAWLVVPIVWCSAQDFEWHTAAPAEVGISREALDELCRALAERRTKAFFVARHDKVVCEWYSPDHGPDRKHGTASLAKAIVGGMALAVALDDGYVTLDEPVSKYIPQWREDPGKAKITIRHLGSHTSGLDDSRPNEEAPWKDAFWRREDPPNNPFTISRDQAP
ncbi:MAG TPA: serine hydrolase domain-containing protein, partial [Thermogutta sp.]|nr:serine hydrolase domain-containing protein [Thermogutta sp.]